MPDLRWHFLPPANTSPFAEEEAPPFLVIKVMTRLTQKERGKFLTSSLPFSYAVLVQTWAFVWFWSWSRCAGAGARRHQLHLILLMKSLKCAALTLPHSWSPASGYFFSPLKDNVRMSKKARGGLRQTKCTYTTQIRWRQVWVRHLSPPTFLLLQGDSNQRPPNHKLTFSNLCTTAPTSLSGIALIQEYRWVIQKLDPPPPPTPKNKHKN